jgi:predicted DNA-binding transcriptional regulator AlpA
MNYHSDIYLKPREAAEFLRTSTSTLAKRRLYGDGPKFCRIGRAIRYLKSDLVAYMARSRVNSTSEYVNGGGRHE